MHKFEVGNRVQYTGVISDWLQGKHGVVRHVRTQDSIDVEFEGLNRIQVGIMGESLTLLPSMLPGSVATEVEPSRGTGLKYDAGKPQARLVIEGFPLVLSGLTDVLTFGAVKYSAHSWQHVENGIDRYNDAANRHMLKRLAGEQVDDESGLDHELHELINRMFVLELKLRERRGTD